MESLTLRLKDKEFYLMVLLKVTNNKDKSHIISLIINFNPKMFGKMIQSPC